MPQSRHGSEAAKSWRPKIDFGKGDPCYLAYWNIFLPFLPPATGVKGRDPARCGFQRPGVFCPAGPSTRLGTPFLGVQRTLQELHDTAESGWFSDFGELVALELSWVSTEVSSFLNVTQNLRLCSVSVQFWSPEDALQPDLKAWELHGFNLIQRNEICLLQMLISRCLKTARSRK